MTRKDYVSAAHLIKTQLIDVKRHKEAQTVASFMRIFFARDNPRFDAARFNVACGLNEQGN